MSITAMPKRRTRQYWWANIQGSKNFSVCPNVISLYAEGKSAATEPDFLCESAQYNPAPAWTVDVEVDEFTGLDLAIQDNAKSEAEEFLADVYVLVRAKDTDLATDRVYDFFDGLLSANPKKIDTCCKVFEVAKIERLNSAIIRSLLLLTSRDKKRIWSRRGFFDRAFTSVAVVQGIGNAKRLLERLR